MRAPPPGVTLLPWQGSPRPGRPCRALPRPCMHCGTSCATASLSADCHCAGQRRYVGSALSETMVSVDGLTPTSKYPTRQPVWNSVEGQSVKCAYFRQSEMGKAHCMNAFSASQPPSRKHTRDWAREPARGGGLRGLRGTFWFVPQSCFHAEWGRLSSRRPPSASDPPSQRGG